MCFVLAGALGAAETSLPKTAAATAQPADQALNGDDLIKHVNLAISWYRQVEAGSQWMTQPSDEFFLSTERNLADKALQSAFASARAGLPLLAPAEPKAKSAGAIPSNAQQEKIAQLAAARRDRIETMKAELATVDDRIRNAPDEAARASLTARKDAIQSELVFLEKLRDALDKVGGLLSRPGEDQGAATLGGQIDSLQQAVADEFGSATPPAAVDSSAARTIDSRGMIGRTRALLSFVKCLRGIDLLIGATSELQGQVAHEQEPLSAAIRGVVQAADQAADRMESADGNKVAETGRQIGDLTEKFDLYWNALLPLRQESVLLDQSRRNLARWRDAISSRESEIAHGLFGRIATIAIMLGVVFAISEIWRRLTLRYVSDDRIRHQLLFVRRLTTGILMVGVIATGFVSDFGSLATFAGFLTAGIAVAMQSILVSIAAYFFLLGRYGLRVGDRITAGGVTGEVAEVGLVRFYLKEYTASGPDLHPTGRVVVFPNSVIFQSNPIFKQLPGTGYTWHEAAITLAPGGNAALAREKILAAVSNAYGEYRPLLDASHHKPEKASGLKIDLPRPYAQLRARERELDLAIGYPVNSEHVSEIDQLVLKHVSEAIAGDPDLAQSVSGHPRIGAAVRG